VKQRLCFFILFLLFERNFDSEPSLNPKPISSQIDLAQAKALLWCFKREHGNARKKT